MKKTIGLVVAILFVISVSALMAEMKCGGQMKTGDMKMDGMKNCKMGMGMDCVMNLNADYSVKDTADGAVITIKAKKGGADAKAIQESAKKCVEMCANKSEKGTTAARNPRVTDARMDGNPDDMVTCPVMGTKFKKKDAYAVYAYRGVKYYLCCAECVKPFNENPDKYIK